MPLLRIGVISDVQGYAAKYDWGMHNLEKAFAILREKSPDILINGGDLADNGDEEVYSFYNTLFHQYFPGKCPINIACAGNHDYSLGRCSDHAARYAAFCNGVEQENSDPLHKEIAGFDFIALSEDPLLQGGRAVYSSAILKKLEKCIRKAVNRDPEKPIFVVTHFPPEETVAGSSKESSPQLRELFNQYPQVFSISSHTHIPLEDERNLWQGEFTALQTGSLSYGCSDEYCYNMCHCILPYAREAVQCLYMEIFPGKIEIHRYNVEDGRELKKESLWQIPYPFDPVNAPYLFSTRKNQRKAPTFRPGTEVFLRYDFGYLFLFFEEAKGEDFVHFYKLQRQEKREDGSWAFLREERYIAPFYRLKRNQDPRIILQLPGESLESHHTYRAEIYAVESFGRESDPLIVEFVNPCSGKLKDGTCIRPQE